MTTEDLLKQRYKVIADYPLSPYNVGDLVEFSNIGTSFHCTTIEDYEPFSEEFVKTENYESTKKLEKWPHLFKKLEWYEDRKPEDLPEYVKVIHGNIGFNLNDVLKVNKWVIGYITRCYFDTYGYEATYFTPSNLEEYNEYCLLNP